MLFAQACVGGLLAEDGVDPGAEVAYRPAPKSRRGTRYAGDLGVLDPFVGQLPGQPRAPKYARIEE